MADAENTSKVVKAPAEMADDRKSLDKGTVNEVRVQELPSLLQDVSEEDYKKLEKKLVRKIDGRLLPPLIIIYIMNYLDRNAIASARLGGLEDDLNLTGEQYQTCVSLLFVGYILMQVPSNIFLNRIGRPSIYLPACMAVWGIICGCSGATHNFTGLAITRFFLGFVEAAYYPGAFATLSTWYTRKEMGMRASIFYCGAMLSGAFSGLITAGIRDGMEGVRGLRSWRWVFLIEGAITVFLSLLAIFVLPDFPANSRWLTDRERQLALHRLEVDAAGEKDWVEAESQPLYAGFQMLLRDKKNWTLVVIVYGAASAISINSFFPTIVATFGKSDTVTLLLTSPPYLLACVTCAAVAWNADRMNERYWHTVIPLGVALVGFIISAAATSIGPRYFGAMIMLPGLYAGYNMTMVWTSNTMYRPPAKRAAAIALTNAISTISGIYSSYLYPNNASPRYVLAFSFYAGMGLMSIGVSTILRFMLKRENERQEQLEREAEAAGLPGPANKGFRYIV